MADLDDLIKKYEKKTNNPLEMMVGNVLESKRCSVCNGELKVISDDKAKCTSCNAEIFIEADCK
ncbi:hypothetical protein [Clostridium butyricum]|uniref:Uncharacterized protein n=1 Tax=Clostridium butyricum TaxID=1492 RepID=A0A6N3FGV3_CLOBU